MKVSDFVQQVNRVLLSKKVETLRSVPGCGWGARSQSNAYRIGIEGRNELHGHHGANISDYFIYSLNLKTDVEEIIPFSTPEQVAEWISEQLAK
ncbi:hypothetical protein [Chromobacterium amazonense]|uniref:hypothetical protein n=1 Tax=Chromobacterium amazonense TaxID=1382803 RepID=UPI003F78FFCB